MPVGGAGQQQRGRGRGVAAVARGVRLRRVRGGGQRAQPEGHREFGEGRFDEPGGQPYLRRGKDVGGGVHGAARVREQGEEGRVAVLGVAAGRPGGQREGGSGADGGEVVAGLVGEFGGVEHGVQQPVVGGAVVAVEVADEAVRELVPLTEPDRPAVGGVAGWGPLAQVPPGGVGVRRAVQVDAEADAQERERAAEQHARGVRRRGLAQGRGRGQGAVDDREEGTQGGRAPVGGGQGHQEVVQVRVCVAQFADRAVAGVRQRVPGGPGEAVGRERGAQLAERGPVRGVGVQRPVQVAGDEPGRDGRGVRVARRGERVEVVAGVEQGEPGAGRLDQARGELGEAVPGGRVDGVVALGGVGRAPERGGELSGELGGEAAGGDADADDVAGFVAGREQQGARVREDRRQGVPEAVDHGKPLEGELAGAQRLVEGGVPAGEGARPGAGVGRQGAGGRLGERGAQVG